MTGHWVISDVGLITATGDATEALHRALCNAEPLVRATGEARAVGPPAVPIDGFQPKAYIQRRGLRDLSRTSQLACVAAAPLARRLGEIDPIHIGVALGTGWGSLESVVDFEWETCSVKPRFLNPLLFAETVSNVPAGQISIFFGWSGFSLTVSCGGASGLEALGRGLDLLEEDRTPMVVAGGADALNRPALQVLEAEGETADGDLSPPFGAQRSGIVGGEGACLLLLESAEHARKRGARPLARLRGCAGRFAGAGGGGEAGSTQIADLLRGLLDQAEVAPGQVDLVASAADGSPADGEEALALHDVFGDGESAPLVMAAKGILGETWGASGPLAAAAALECMRHELVPGRPRGFIPDPYLPPLRMPAEATKATVRHAVIVARSRGGQVSAVLLTAAGGS